MAQPKLLRSAYLSRLRRAFLLRVHPDRFLDPTVRTQQASLVKALANRMDQSDFTDWIQQLQRKQRRNSNLTTDKTYPFVMEKRDGSLFQSSIALDSSVDDILLFMSNSLERTGAAALPPPFQPTSPTGTKTVNSESDRHRSSSRSSSPHTTSDFIHSRYNVRSNQGRNLRDFLLDKTLCSTSSKASTGSFSGGEHSLMDRIRHRKAARMDAQAVASQVRRLYQFAAVDATETKWSSDSVAVLLRRLLSLHPEFCANLHVQSFYPIRLVFSPMLESESSDALDVYAGVLRLNPASTSIQWLECLRLVTPDLLYTIQKHRTVVEERTKLLQAYWRVKLKRGFTCKSLDYFFFLERLARHLGSDYTTPSTSTPIVGSAEQFLIPIVEHNDLDVEPVLNVVVEDDSVCRRAKVTQSGHIQVGVDVSLADCIKAITNFSNLARTRSWTNEEALRRCSEASTAVQLQLGLQKVYRTTTDMVPHDDYLDCLSRVETLWHQEQNHVQLWQALMGNSLGIAANGQHCHLADDGSIVIPQNWI